MPEVRRSILFSAALALLLPAMLLGGCRASEGASYERHLTLVVQAVPSPSGGNPDGIVSLSALRER
jgi:hypothetical protein